MSIRRGVVLLDRRRVGVIEETADGRRTRFTYDPAWLASKDAEEIALTMALRPEPYEAADLLPFFANLLPEGWLLDITTAKLKLSKDDAFGILLATCRDCPGAVSVEPIDLDA
jgi:serine/threonine-protein kinase HipA